MIWTIGAFLVSVVGAAFVMQVMRVLMPSIAGSLAVPIARLADVLGSTEGEFVAEVLALNEEGQGEAAFRLAVGGATTEVLRLPARGVTGVARVGAKAGSSTRLAKSRAKDLLDLIAPYRVKLLGAFVFNSPVAVGLSFVLSVLSALLVLGWARP